MADETLRLRIALRDLVALSTIPAGWIGIEPRTIAAGLADILAGSLGFDFAFVRLLNPSGGVTIDVTSGCATRDFWRPDPHASPRPPLAALGAPRWVSSAWLPGPVQERVAALICVIVSPKADAHRLPPCVVG
jgi:hypothetical protein